MGQENALPLFLYAVQDENTAAAQYLWADAEQSIPKIEYILPYLDLLIMNKNVPVASDIWNKYFPSETLLYNGQFSQPPVLGGFGWRIWETSGVEVDHITQNNRPMLHLHFTGEKNVNYYHLLQLVVLPPGKSFLLSGELRSRGLTTDQKPFIEVVPFYEVTLTPDPTDLCSLHTATEMIQAEQQDWTPFTLFFTVPEECSSGVRIRISRRPSRNIDNLISGDLWLTNFSLQETTAPAASIPVQDSVQ
jgi:hypothetical protein